MKDEFQPGDRVRLKYLPGRGVGEVVEKTITNQFNYRLTLIRFLGISQYFPTEDLELAETPIERMRRLYKKNRLTSK